MLLQSNMAMNINTDPLLIKNESDEQPNHNPDDDNYYLTMHPLNNLKLKPPKSILSVSPNQMAINVAINKGETMHYIGSLDKTSLCDCFSYNLPKETGSKCNTEQSSDDQSNRFCHCVEIEIKHKKFNRLRVDLLFDESEYEQVMDDKEYNEQYAIINVVLYDNESRIWSGIQLVKINEILNEYRIISKLSLRCSQTLLKKSVTIIGSLCWSITSHADIHQNNKEQSEYMYPYKSCSLPQMILILGQHRYDLINSYETVKQQRNSAKNSKKNSLEPVVRQHQIHPNGEHCLDKQMDDLKLFPDGGSNKPTKRNSTRSIANPTLFSVVIDDKYVENALLGSTSFSKNPGFVVEEMENELLQKEVARIDSMVLGAEHALFAVNNGKSSENLQNKRDSPLFPEMTTSLTSSYMFGANELQNVKTKIAEHLSEQKKNVDDENVLQEPVNSQESDENVEKKERVESEYDVSALRAIPICLSCQRCSRTILLCQQIE